MESATETQVVKFPPEFFATDHGSTLLRPPSSAQRILHRRRHRARWRSGGGGEGGFHACAGAHRPQQRLRAGEVLQGGARFRRQACRWLRRVRDQRCRARAAVPPAAAVPVACGLPAPVRPAHARLSGEPVPRSPRDTQAMAECRHGWSDRIVRGASRRGRRHAAERQCRQREARRAGLCRAVPQPFLPGSAALRRAARGAAPARDGEAGGRAGAAGGGHASGAVPHHRRLQGARGARVHRRRLCAERQAPAAPVHRAAIFQDAGGNGETVRRPAGSVAEQRGDRQALQHLPEAGQAVPAQFPHAQRREPGRFPAQRIAARPAGAHALPVPGRGAACFEDAGIPGAARVRDRDHHQDGLPRLLPDRVGLHPLGQGLSRRKVSQRRAGRAGARFRRGLAGGVFARHHRPRSAALRIAVRALPQPRARVHARLRRGLLPGRARAGDPVRAPPLRRGLRVADRHLRHHGLQGRDPRRRARAGFPLRPVRQAVQAGAARRRETGVAREGARDGAGVQRHHRQRRRRG